MDNGVQWAAVLGMAGVAALFAVEVRRWRLLGPMMSRGQRILRVVLIVFIEALFAMMLVGPAVTSRKNPMVSLLYWTWCLILGLIVVILALLDLRAVIRQYWRLNKQMFRDLKGNDRRKS
jgi:hypothetical protein